MKRQTAKPIELTRPSSCAFGDTCWIITKAKKYFYNSLRMHTTRTYTVLQTKILSVLFSADNYWERYSCKQTTLYQAPLWQIILVSSPCRSRRHLHNTYKSRHPCKKVKSVMQTGLRLPRQENFDLQILQKNFLFSALTHGSQKSRCTPTLHWRAPQSVAQHRPILHYHCAASYCHHQWIWNQKYCYQQTRCLHTSNTETPTYQPRSTVNWYKRGESRQ